MMINRTALLLSHKISFPLAIFKKKAIFSPKQTIQG